MTGHRHIEFSILTTFLVLATLPTQASGAWVRMEAPPGSSITRLIDATGAPTGPDFVILERGDTLTFALTQDADLRIVTRPLVALNDEIGIARFGFALGDAEPRRLKRKSQPDASVSLDSTIKAVYGVGKTNRVPVPGAQAGQTLKLWSRQRDGRPVLVRVLRHRAAREKRSTNSPASRVNWDSHVVLTALGYDDNAYLAPADQNTEVAKAFANLEASTGIEARLARRLFSDLSYTFRGRFYDDVILNETRHRLAAGQRWRSAPRGGWKIAATEYLKWSDKTFFGRGADEEFETSDDTGSLLLLGDRFDHREAGAGIVVARSLSDRFRWSVQARKRNRNYSEDYTDVADIYALDYTAHRVESRLEVKLGGPWQARVHWQRSWKQYEDKPARDAEGTTLSDSFMELRYNGFGVRLKRRPNQGWLLNAGWGIRSTEDLQAGYWDVDRTSTNLGLGWRWTGGHQVDISWRHVRYPYKNSRLSYDPAQDLRDKTITNWRLRAIRSVGTSRDLVVEIQDQDTDYNSPTFAYHRRFMSVGMEFKF